MKGERRTADVPGPCSIGQVIQKKPILWGEHGTRRLRIDFNSVLIGANVVADLSGLGTVPNKWVCPDKARH
jgi:hypothetical protein